MLSYAHGTDGWLRRRVIGAVERVSGMRTLEARYRRTKESGLADGDVWSAALRTLGIDMMHYGMPLERLPCEGSRS